MGMVDVDGRLIGATSEVTSLVTTENGSSCLL